MYELLVVSKISESDGLIARVEKALKSASAQELKINKLGKKNLAYNIKKQTEADYTIFTFTGEGTIIGEISEMLRLEQDALLRHMIVKQKVRKLRKKVEKREERVEVKREEKKPQVTIVTKDATLAKKSTAKVEVKVKVTKEIKTSMVSKGEVKVSVKAVKAKETKKKVVKAKK